VLIEKDVDDTSMDIETTPRKFMCQWCVKILGPHSNKTFAILYKIRSTQLFLLDWDIRNQDCRWFQELVATGFLDLELCFCLMWCGVQ
jgi:hypothetical protein